MTEELKFNVRSGIKSILGKDLITNDITAVVELVKNCFDAGAKEAVISFLGEGKTPRIIIEDDGTGMSETDITGKWMRVGYSEKGSTERNGDRIFAGSKGIGRFSCDRLGETLSLFSRTKKDAKVNCLRIDWRRFDDDKSTQFNEIGLPFKQAARYPKIRFREDWAHRKNGTTLIIGQLRSTWTEEKLHALEMQLARLLNPFSNDFSNFTIILRAPNLDLEKNIKNDFFEDLDTVYVKSSVDEEGRVETLLINRGKVHREATDPTPETKRLRNTNLTIYYLDQGAKLRFAKRMGVPLVRYGSIFFYRNGFRILPYGDVGDDWLGIDKRHAQQLFRTLGLRDIIGYVDIRLPESEGFSDISSRQGLNEESAEFAALKEFINGRFRKLETYVISSWNDEKKAKAEKSAAFQSVEKAVSQISNPQLKKFAKTSLKKIKQLERHQHHEVKALKHINMFLKATAHTSPDTLALIHTIKISSSNIESNVREIRRGLGSQDLANRIMKHLNRIHLEAHKILAASKLATRANFDMNVEKIRGDLLQYFSEYLDSYQAASAKNIEIAKELEGASYPASFSPLAIAIIADNLIDNAYKAHAHTIRFLLRPQPKSLLIEVLDDGKGITAENSRHLFEMGFTTTDGSGLGLHHVRELVEAIGGEVTFAGKGIKGQGACFRITLPLRQSRGGS